jgi:hypothetical protein
VSHNDFYPENLSINSEQLIALLNGSEHWCVVYSSTGDGDSMADNIKFLQSAHAYIVKHASKSITLGYQPNWNKTYTFYVK